MSTAPLKLVLNTKVMILTVTSHFQQKVLRRNQSGDETTD